MPNLFLSRLSLVTGSICLQLTQPILSRLEVNNGCPTEFPNPQLRAQCFTHQLSYLILQQYNVNVGCFVMWLFGPAYSTELHWQCPQQSCGRYLSFSSLASPFSTPDIFLVVSVYVQVISIRGLTPLPYANLLALVFKYFGVSSESEVRESKPAQLIMPMSLKQIQFPKPRLVNGNLLMRCQWRSRIMC